MLPPPDLPPQAVVAASLAVAVLFALWVFRTSRKESYRPPPVAGTVLHVFWHYRRLYDYLTDLARRHKTFRLFDFVGNQVFTVDPANVEYILQTNFSNYGKGWYAHEYLSNLFGDGIFVVDGDKWRHQRKLASFEFSTKALRDFSGIIFKKNSAKVAQIILEAANAGSIVDIQDLLMKSTMDTIFEIAFNVELNSLFGMGEEEERFSRAFDESINLIGCRILNIFWKVTRLFNIGYEAKLKKNIKLIDDFIYKLITAKGNIQHSQQRVKKEDILSRFLIESEKDPQEMNHKYLRDIILNILIAGKDTTAVTLSWFLYMLCRNPSIQEKLSQEIKDAMKRDKYSSFHEFAASISDDALNKMQYLHATLSETLRLYPVVASDPKVCFSDDTLPDGFNLRKGDVISYLPYAMGRMKFLWGEDACVFSPERWLDDNGRFFPESPFKFTAFQAGPRICMGKEFAYRQMKIFSVVLLHFFAFQLSDAKKDVNYKNKLTLQIDEGLQIRATCR